MHKRRAAQQGRSVLGNREQIKEHYLGFLDDSKSDKMLFAEKCRL